MISPYSKYNKPPLTQEDVLKLASDKTTPHAKIVAASKVAATYSVNTLSPEEKAMAEEIMRLLTKDVEDRVRESLAEELKDTVHLPPDIALKLAEDKSDKVALPIIKNSKVLSNEHMIRIIRTGSETRQVAIASRSHVSADVAAVLAQEGTERAVETLVGNTGAELDTQSLTHITTRFKENDSIKKKIIVRPKVDPSFMDRMMQNATEELKKFIINHHQVSEKDAEKIVRQAKEKTVIRISASATEQEIRSLAFKLYNEGNLTPSILIRSLCVGEKTFFEHAVSFLTSKPVGAVRRLLYGTDAEVQSIYEEAGLPPELYAAVKIAIDIIKETLYRNEKKNQDAFAEMVVRRLFNQMKEFMEGEDLDELLQSANGRDIEYLLSMLER